MGANKYVSGILGGIGILCLLAGFGHLTLYKEGLSRAIEGFVTIGIGILLLPFVNLLTVVKILLFLAVLIFFRFFFSIF